LKAKLSGYDTIVAKTNRVYETSGKLRHKMTNIKLTPETANTKIGDEISSSEPIFNCHIFLTSEMFHKRQKSISPDILSSGKSKNTFIAKSPRYISDFVFTKSTYKFRFAMGRVKQTKISVNIKSKFEKPHDNSFAASINSNDIETDENKNVTNMTETTVILSIITDHKNGITGCNTCALNIHVKNSIATIYLACSSAISPEAQVLAGFVTVLPIRICGRRFCNSMEHYFEGRYYSLHRLQQEGELISVSNKFGVT
jgi:hypothetical protein